MPAQLTRTCRGCSLERNTPQDFREPGETGPGRPPVFCRVCRAGSPALQAARERAVARRPKHRARSLAYSLRPESEVLAYREAAHPGGAKVCPATSGCGELLPLSEFGVATYHPDGLESVCRPCGREHDLLLRLKSSPVYTL